MNIESDTLVFWILIPIFILVGIYLIWYSRHRKKILETFANTHQFRISPNYEQELQKILDKHFSLGEKGLVRSFSQISTIVKADGIWLFRAVELLDLNPHAVSYSTHYSRVIALFKIKTDYDEFFILDRSQQVSRRLPGAESPDQNAVEILRQIAKTCETRHSLSVTLKQSAGLIYFEPLVTGGETISDVDSLYCIAKNMHQRLS